MPIAWTRSRHRKRNGAECLILASFDCHLDRDEPATDSDDEVHLRDMPCSMRPTMIAAEAESALIARYEMSPSG